MSRLSTGARWTIVGMVLVAALIAVMLSQQHDQRRRAPQGQDPVAARERRDADTPEALAELFRQAQLPPCPNADSAPGTRELAGITLECSGAPVAVGSVLAGRQVVLNLWAYWCGPCADELPAMAELQRRAGDKLTVVTVHQDENEAAGLAKLAELHVRLPMIQDGARRIAAALKSPNVMPTTILIRADGSVARVLPRSFTSADEIGAEVEQALGVRF
ncbi:MULTISPECIES: TlpA family protein disulfide reductase [Mycobacteroides]|nr:MULTISPECIES: TlpA disulfide reductase family protein [Mycobacteroides]MBV6362784.1 TlpA family protein disulfide reductase [Mycobacteroides chelonae]MEC4836325.1 TlpA disulfide reductase family protein [Mycobacteroides chelonae]MEC4855218.1 TlpA disulfide reductase family protein [Mycobacteroides chelonae]MEC4873918.1 TlpA disulfide reductase family protein [Mycobacteroides chelonae]UJW66255.1 TlpA family protein disulfide reductase [Mycobacteroides chelonae]